MTGQTLWKRWWKVPQSTPSHISCPLYTLTVLDYLSISVLSLTKMAYLLTNVLSLVGDGQLLMCVLDHWQNVYLCLWTQPVKLKPLWKSTVCFKAEKTRETGKMMDFVKRKLLSFLLVWVLLGLRCQQSKWHTRTKFDIYLNSFMFKGQL